ncbi:hypothetical protein [Microbacterium sp. NPDC055357]
MDTALFTGFAAGYVLLLAWGIALGVRHGWLTPANLPLLVLGGLVYDNTVIAAGAAIGEGALLEGLSAGRFWVHAFVTPLLVVWSWHAVRRAGQPWASTRIAAVVAVVITAALIVFEIVTVLAGLTLEPGTEYGVLSYSDADAAGPPIMVLFVAAALILAGFFVWRRQGWIWLLVGAVIMTVGSAVPIPLDSGAVTNAFELALLVSILATKARQDRFEAKQKRDAAAQA